MRKALAVLFIVWLMAYAPILRSAATTESFSAQQTGAPLQDQSAYVSFTPEQLDNLLAPIALYPDPLLAQVLPASTFPEEIDGAARWLRANSDPNSVDMQPWDVSVKSVSHYPAVLYMMADKLDWTTTLGQAYVYQSTDVMASVQRLRALAQSSGALTTTPQQQVVAQSGQIYIWPAQPRYIYVPHYDPAIVYLPHYDGGYAGYGGHGYPRSFLSFGVGFVIGAWLNYDMDWGGHRIYYHGWDGGHGYGGGYGDHDGWRERSRPFVNVNNNVYVNNNYNTVVVNNNVVNRTVNVNNLKNYNSVNKNVTYNNVAQNNLKVRNNPSRNVNSVNPNPNRNVNNQVIQRGMNPNDPRLDKFRGRPQPPLTQPNQQTPPAQLGRQGTLRPAPGAPRQAVTQAQARPTPQAPQRVYTPPRTPYNVNRGNFDPPQTVQRGQASREQMNRPVPRYSAPQQRSAPAPRYSAPQRSAPPRSAPQQRSAPQPRSSPPSKPAPRPSGGRP